MYRCICVCVRGSAINNLRFRFSGSKQVEEKIGFARVSFTVC